MSKRFDELFGEIVDILRHDWAGRERFSAGFDPRYYNTAVGQAWRDGKLDDLLFLRYMSQMLACTRDRHLRLSLRPSPAYTPWGPGFFTRRHGDSLYVTALRGETRLAVGDRITAIQGGSPARHRAAIQKNFFYSDETEREDWNGFLKMADTVDVKRLDGSTEQLALKRFPLHPLPAAHRVMERSEGLILDLRNAGDLSEDETLALLPLLCREDTPLAELTGGEVMVNYTRRNCMVKAAGLQGIPGGEEFIDELREKSGQGFLSESDDDNAVIPGRAKGPVTVLIDTWTRDGAEFLALAAKRARAVLIGRPTLGTIDLCGDVSLELDEKWTFTWPTAISKAAYEGRPLGPVAPDVYIPWTPAECHEDLILDAAEKYLKVST